MMKNLGQLLKDYIQNIKLIKNLSVFHSLGVPLMLGVSRKRFIESISSNSKPQQRLGGTVAATLLAMTQGIKIHRVHDVQQINQALVVFDRLFNRWKKSFLVQTELEAPLMNFQLQELFSIV